MTRKLLVINPDHYVEVQFDQQITIGRDVFNSLCLQDAEVSRSHAIIFDQDGEMTIKDLKSRNGCYVRGERTAETTLHPGDEIILGSTVLIFDPPDTLDLQGVLSRRGHYLVEKRAAKIVPPRDEHPTIFTCDQMDDAIRSLLTEADNTSYFSHISSIMLLQSFKEMDDAADSTLLFEFTVRRALAIMGGHRGVIMETDQSHSHLKVRALVSIDNSDTIVIGQQVLRLVLAKQSGVYCSNVLRDKRFDQLAAKCKRAIHSFVAAPIRSRDELFGFFYLDSEDDSVSYDYAALRSLYLLSSHLGALLRTRAVHYPHPVVVQKIVTPSK